MGSYEGEVSGEDKMKQAFKTCFDPDTTIILPMSPSVNSLFANAGKRFVRGKIKDEGRIKTKKYKQWIDDATSSLWTQKYKTFNGPIAVMYSIQVKDKRRRDAGNYEKALSDFLVRAGIIADDSLIRDNRQRFADEGADWEGVKVEIFSLHE